MFFCFFSYLAFMDRSKCEYTSHKNSSYVLAFSQQVSLLQNGFTSCLPKRVKCEPTVSIPFALKHIPDLKM